MAFPPIVGVGDRSALPHMTLSSRRVAEADFLLVDWGVRAGLYHSDLTRVALVRQGPSRNELLKADYGRCIPSFLKRKLVRSPPLRPGVSREGC